MTEDVEALLASLRASREDPRLAMDGVRERMRAVRSRHAERVRNDPDGLPAAIVEALVAASGPEAPVELQRVRRLVDDGLLTWQAQYADPEGTAGVEGRALVRRAQQRGTFGVPATEEELQEQQPRGYRPPEDRPRDQGSQRSGAPRSNP
ncbi:hypothetical protein [Nocardioides zeae]|uniref:Uncharacterized protein n=1 Tax=Nocardioides zeae TaxID=1457234 RepID=A0A6P0HHC3_9ACTN|nr:hypothetical protein [Nocardioides zeae]NEN77981.1 hypothetical protein [Nocardioides zeae]